MLCSAQTPLRSVYHFGSQELLALGLQLQPEASEDLDHQGART